MLVFKMKGGNKIEITQAYDDSAKAVVPVIRCDSRKLGYPINYPITDELKAFLSKVLEVPSVASEGYSAKIEEK